MDFKKVAGQAQAKAAEAAAAGQQKIDDIIDEFNEILPFVEELGLRMSSFNIEAGLLPQIQASFIGSIDGVNNDVVERLIQENEKNKLLVAFLNAILMTKKIHGRLKGAYIAILKDLVIDVKLGLPPSISCRFQ